MPHSFHTEGLHASLIPYRWITYLTNSIQKDYMPHSSHIVGFYTSLIQSRRITCLTHPIQQDSCLNHSIQKDYMPHSSHTVRLYASLIPYSRITCLYSSHSVGFMPHSFHTEGLHASLVSTHTRLGKFEFIFESIQGQKSGDQRLAFYEKKQKFKILCKCTFNTFRDIRAQIKPLLSWRLTTISH